MELFGLWLACLLVIVPLPALAKPLTPDGVNAATLDAAQETGPERAVLVRAQVILDRSRYSPGVIDGLYGDSTEIALKAFQADHALEATGELDEASFAKLIEADAEPVLVRYTITARDLKGPFQKTIPKNIAKMAKLKRMSFRSPREALSERFHMNEEFLAMLNPDADFGKEGTEIVIAAVEGKVEEGQKVVRLVIDKGERTLRVVGEKDELIALYPATVGSEENPAPDGELKVTGVFPKPAWNYDPKLKLTGRKHRPNRRLTIPAGPNNPVGVVWIDLSKEHFGIHGSPEPEKIGKNQSSGCVRLTNWDAQELAQMVKEGTTVLFEE